MKKIIVALAALALALSCTPKMPVIGISCNLGSEGYSRVSSNYFNAVLTAGGVPVAVPLTDNEKVLERILKNVDGLILTGGEDVDPARYGEAPSENLGKVNGRRDTCDFAIAGTALKLKKPILAICRGEQLLNVCLGGSLHQDIPSEIDSELTHRVSTSEKAHKVGIYPDTRFGRVMKIDSLEVNSAHHQCVKCLAPGLKLVAASPDGVVECYENDKSIPSFVLGIQSHPEVFAQKGEEPYLSIFKYFLKACK